MTWSRLTLIAALVVLSGCAAVREGHAPSGTEVGVRGAQILINGTPATLFGFRVGSAALREDWTQELIAQLDEWQRHGVNSFTLWLQGTSGGYHRVFTRDGGAVSTGLDNVISRTGYGLTESAAIAARVSGVEIVERARRIVEAADRRGMVVVIGIAYRSAWSTSDTPAIVERAMSAAAAAFRDHRNVIFNVWNETDTRHALERPEAVAGYVAAIRRAAPGRPVCAGSLQSPMNLELASVPGLDLFCQDAGRNLKDTLAAYEALAALGKPIINVESYGGNGGGYVDDRARQVVAPAGFFVDFSAKGGWRRVYGAWEEDDYQDATGRPLMGKRSYRELIRYVGRDASRQRHLFVHVAGWFQGASRVEVPEHLAAVPTPGRWNNHFGPGHGAGDGSPGAPGIRWLLEEIGRAARR